MPLESPISPPFLMRPPSRLVLNSGADFSTSNGYSTLKRLLGRRGTLGHEATVEHRGPITFWAGTKRGLYPRAGTTQGEEIGGDWRALCKALAEIFGGEDGFEAG